MAAGSLLFIPSSIALPIARIFWVVCGSATSFCWAKIDKAALIANPTRGTNKCFFIISSRRPLRAYWVLGLTAGDGVAAGCCAKLLLMSMTLSGVVFQAC